MALRVVSSALLSVLYVLLASLVLYTARVGGALSVPPPAFACARACGGSNGSAPRIAVALSDPIAAAPVTRSGER